MNYPTIKKIKFKGEYVTFKVSLSGIDFHIYDNKNQYIGLLWLEEKLLIQSHIAKGDVKYNSKDLIITI